MIFFFHAKFIILLKPGSRDFNKKKICQTATFGVFSFVSIVIFTLRWIYIRRTDGGVQAYPLRHCLLKLPWLIFQIRHHDVRRFP